MYIKQTKIKIFIDKYIYFKSIIFNIRVLAFYNVEKVLMFNVTFSTQDKKKFFNLLIYEL